MRDFLPLGTLKNVRDLCLKVFFKHKPEWPETWDQLTSITRLELKVWTQSDLLSPQPHPLLPFRIESLVDVSVTAHYGLFDTSGEDYLLFLTGSLPVLSRFQITIVDLPKRYDGSVECKTSKRLQLHAICKAVQLRTPGLEYTILEMTDTYLQSVVHVQLIFALPGM